MSICNQRVLCLDNNCKECFEKSLASHEKHMYLLNKEVDNPRFIFKFSNKKYDFKCNNCNHIFNSMISNVTDIKKNRWCPYCVNKKLCNNETCNSCFKKSFASYPQSEFIVDKNKK